jgi:hypothetical protein
MSLIFDRKAPIVIPMKEPNVNAGLKVQRRPFLTTHRLKVQRSFPSLVDYEQDLYCSEDQYKSPNAQDREGNE